MNTPVSIIVPCYNEETTITQLLEAIHAQTYDHALLDVVIADGMSTDGTREKIAAFGDSHPELKIKVVDNPRRNIPAALNLALGMANGEIILRQDAHSIPYPDNVKYTVENLEAGSGMNVGGVCEIRPGADTWAGRSIAVAARHPLGVGDARYRHTNQAASVDTVAFVAFKREVIDLVGSFDESLLANEDYEFNARVRAKGGVIWLDPRIRSVYFARGTFRGLAKQYWRYGYWKYRMLRRYPRTIRPRQGLPPLFLLSLVILAGLGILWSGFHVLLGLEMASYLLILAAAGIRAALKESEAGLMVGLPAAIAVMHLSWGSGFLWSIIKGITIKDRTKM